MYWSFVSIYRHKRLYLWSLLFLFIETQELCEARAFETARARSELFTFQRGQ